MTENKLNEVQLRSLRDSKDKLKRHRDNWKKKAKDLAGLVSELVAMLDYMEETDNGRPFHPTYFSSCRIMHSIKFDEIFPKIKEQSQNILKEDI